MHHIKIHVHFTGPASPILETASLCEIRFCGQDSSFWSDRVDCCWGVSRSRMTLSTQRLWWRDQEGPWCWGREGPWCGSQEGPWCGGRSRPLWSPCWAWWPKEEVHGNRTVFHLLLVEQIEYPLQVKGWWESNINVWFPFMYSQKWNCKASLFPKENYNVLFPSSCTHISVRDFYISRIGLSIFCCIQICRPILGIFKSLTDTWMYVGIGRAIPFLGIHKLDFMYSSVYFFCRKNFNN